MIDDPARHGAAAAVIVHGDYGCVDTLGETGATHNCKLKCNVLQIREELWQIRLTECDDVETCVLRSVQQVKDYNLCLEPSTFDAKTFGNMTDEGHMIYLLCRLPRNVNWQFFLELSMVKNPTATVTPD